MLSKAGNGSFVDVRSPEEFRGEKLAPDHLPQEQSQVPGHIPGAANIPWAKAANDDGTFKSADELRALYEGGVTADAEVIAYCRIGERSSHTWFALVELLGYPDVKNYDGRGPSTARWSVRLSRWADTDRPEEDRRLDMAVTDELLQANERFAEGFDRGDLPMPPARNVAVLACMDARLHPETFLGLDIGDAHMIRNAGGRASDDAIRSLVISTSCWGPVSTW